MGLCSFEPARVRALGPPAGRIPPPPQPDAVRETSDRATALGVSAFSPRLLPTAVCAAHRLHQKDLSLAKWRRLLLGGPCVLRL